MDQLIFGTLIKQVASGKQNNKCVVNIAAKIKIEEKQTKVAKERTQTRRI